jgi:hypothetical protein
MWRQRTPFERPQGWTIEDEQRQKIAGGNTAVKFIFLTVSLNGAQHLIYADPESNVMKKPNGRSKRTLASWKEAMAYDPYHK